jgi:hypothetical protein
MAYCRFGRDSDVYVFEMEGGIECCRCRIAGGTFEAGGAAEMIEHLLKHRAAGHAVPDEALRELREDLEFGRE